ncbi:DUF1641 domain-containing protein [Melioribacter sp. Ez-97]|uniref:DUF1641 domain-containing protein n=1 Tax=Melioribacter sp. Ez-97 TaxID=3423434 RepID=UPI003ED93FB0
MDETKIQNQIEELNRKLDIVLEEIELQRRHRREMDDLKDDLMRVGTDLYKTAVEELDEISDSFNTADLLHLGKKLLRNVNTINKAVEQLESIKDFFEDFAPISRDGIIDLMNKLDEYDRKGYFDFMRETRKILDNVVTSFSPEDVRALADNIVMILSTIKNLTQPEMLNTLNNVVNVYKNLNIKVKEDVSLISLLKEMNDPEVKRGLAFGIEFLKNIANQPKELNVNTKQ